MYRSLFNVEVFHKCVKVSFIDGVKKILLVQVDEG